MERTSVTMSDLRCAPRPNSRSWFVAVAVVALAACSPEDSSPTTTSTVASSTSSAPDESVLPEVTSTTSEPDDRPVVLMGTGTADVAYPEGVERVVVHATHAGSGVFSVGVVNAEGEAVESVAFALPGDPYDGTQLITTPLAEVSLLRVRADGAWTIELLTAADVPVVGEEFSGDGATVVRYEGAGGAAAIASDAIGVFRVRLLDGRFVVPERNGPVSATESLPPGPVLVEVKSFGYWAVVVDPAGPAAEPTETAGSTISEADAALVNLCLSRWVDAQALAAEDPIAKERWDAAFVSLTDACAAAQGVVAPIAIRSPLGSPMSVLGDVVDGILLLAADTAAQMGSCVGACDLSDSVRQTLMQFERERFEVPESLYGELSGGPAITVASIPELLVTG